MEGSWAGCYDIRPSRPCPFRPRGNRLRRLRLASLPLLLAAASLSAQPGLDTLPPPAGAAEPARDTVGAAPPAAEAVPIVTAAPSPATAEPPPAPAPVPRAPAGPRGLVTIGGAEEERLRDAQLRGVVASGGFLLRSPSALTPRAGRSRLRVLAPEASLAWNSRIPVALNDGAMWGARGAGAMVMAGFEAEAGPLRLIVAPEVVYTANDGFDGLLPQEWDAEQRASFSAPWQTGRHSIDLPVRPGGESIAQLRPGQSSLALRAGAVELGAATESQWWGPGIRNAIVLSNQSAGIPHLFFRTDPVRTPAGSIQAEWIAAGLRDSRWFSGAEGGRWRSLSAAALVLQPAGTNLSLGAARSVYAPAGSAGDAAGHAADVFTRWRGAGDSLASRPFEQITSVFGRLLLPRDGAEAYFEWARYRLPASLRDLMAAPEHTQGYTLGFQWLRIARAGELRLQGELTYLEKSPTYRSRPIGSYYASAAVPQGYTNDGQGIGAAVGPGGSGQWLAADLLRGGGRLGVFAGRVRWTNDAYYDNPVGPKIFFGGDTVPQARQRGHDVSILGGMRGAVPLGTMVLDAEWMVSRRYNFLFQNYSTGWTDREKAVNVLNHTLRLRLSPR